MPSNPLRLATTNASDLDALGRRYGTDKVRHGFTQVYAQALAPLRESARSLLEVGVFLGGSLLMWRDFLPHATIHGVDLFADAGVFGRAGHMKKVKPSRGAPSIDSPAAFFRQWQQGAFPRVHLLNANQSDPAQLERVARRLGTLPPFDVIIDDGSHLHRDQQTALALLFPLVRPGGVYIIEDLHTCVNALP